MKKISIVFTIVVLTGCGKLIETKACEITNSDNKSDVGQCIKLSKSVFGKNDSLMACKAAVNSHMKNKYGNKSPGNVLFSTSTNLSCK